MLSIVQSRAWLHLSPLRSICPGRLLQIGRKHLINLDKIDNYSIYIKHVHRYQDSNVTFGFKVLAYCPELIPSCQDNG